MGSVLAKPVESVVIKRCSGPLFRVGFAEINGWRKSMEDAHVIMSKDRWGFFGVLDGHGGSQCSTFVSRKLIQELAQGPPADDVGVKELMLRLDREFLATCQPSGSTGTFAIVTPPAPGERKYNLRIGNIGDSRVLLGCADGSMFEGAGTDGALTTDHKPDHPIERERIERTGGSVVYLQNIPRVNGDLAVSRSFGDSAYKQTGGPSQEDHPVSAAPELTALTCDSTHFLALVCDGISEGEFPNREVIKLAAEELRNSNEKPDPGKAAAAVCRQALAKGSNDNLSCMIVLLGGGDVHEEVTTFWPGPFTRPTDSSFRKAYAAMAEHAGMSFAAALEMRYDVACEALCKGQGNSELLRSEKAAFGDGPPKDLQPGSEARVEWFNAWLAEHQVEEEPDLNSMNREELIEYATRHPEMVERFAVAVPVTKRVTVAPLEKLRPAVDAIHSLRWDDQLAEACGKEGSVLEQDASDDTSKVQFRELGFTAWLPTSTLTDVTEAANKDVKDVSGDPSTAQNGAGKDEDAKDGQQAKRQKLI